MEDVAPNEETTAVVEEEQHLPTHEERLEHCYEELRAIRAEIAEIRAHSHAEYAHSTHEHPEHARHDHIHEAPPDSDKTGEPTTEIALADGTGSSDDRPSPTHPYFRKIGAK